MNIVVGHVNLALPVRKLSALMEPSCIFIRSNRSSMRISYTEISPLAKPMPTTSIAGDWVSAVMAVELLSGDIEGDVNNDDALNLCMLVLHWNGEIDTCCSKYYERTESGCSTVALLLDCSLRVIY